jgi:hypothetical protein
MRDILCAHLESTRIPYSKLKGIMRYCSEALEKMMFGLHQTIPVYHIKNGSKVDGFIYSPLCMDQYFDSAASNTGPNTKPGKGKTKTSKSKEHKPGKHGPRTLALCHCTCSSMRGKIRPDDTATLFYTHHKHDGRSYYTIVALGQHVKSGESKYDLYWRSPLFEFATDAYRYKWLTSRTL